MCADEVNAENEGQVLREIGSVNRSNSAGPRFGQPYQSGLFRYRPIMVLEMARVRVNGELFLVHSVISNFRVQ